MAWDLPRLVTIDRFADARGGFFTPWDRSAGGQAFSPDSLHFSHNPRAGTLRGLHYQRAPCLQQKLVYCLRGSAFDVVVDMREGSPTYARWTAFGLKALEDAALLIPGGYAHGFLTLEPDTVLAYLISGPYRPEMAGGVRFDDPGLAIDWPARPLVISDKDLAWPTLPS